jgi:hypothetical protein
MAAAQPQAPAAQPLDLQVQEYHAIGTKLLEQRAEARKAAGYKDATWIKAQVTNQRKRPSVLYRILQLAEYYEGEGVQTLGGLTWRKVVVLLSVRDAGRRASLTSQAIAKSWKQPELTRQVRKCKARRSPRKEPLKVGTTRSELVKLEILSQSWLRRVSSKAWSPHRRSELGGFPPHDNKLSEYLGRAERAMKRLLKQIMLALPDPGPGAGPR